MAENVREFLSSGSAWLSFEALGASLRLGKMNAKGAEQPDGLINVLLDSSAEFGDRDDAAMDLGAFDESQAFDALYSIASDPGEDADLQERCGESLAQICRRQSRSDTAFVARLSPSARRLFVATLNETNATGNA